MAATGTKIRAVCHPERDAWAHHLCRSCFDSVRKTGKLPTTLRGPERIAAEECVPLVGNARKRLHPSTIEPIAIKAAQQSAPGNGRTSIGLFPSRQARQESDTVERSASNRGPEHETTMLTIRKRGRALHVDGFVGDKIRVRGSLGTHNQDAARRLVHKMEIALSEGAQSQLWVELRSLLPHFTFVRFADVVGVKQRPLPTWCELRDCFNTHMAQQVTIGKLQSSTTERYRLTVREFETFLQELKITLLQDITKPLVETFKVWRTERIKKRKNSRGGTGLVLDAAILHRVFAFAFENEMIVKNPVRMEGTPGDNPENGAEPFTAHELSRLRAHASDDLLMFLLLRWTGFRGSDAVSVSWREVHFDRREIERVTQKRRKRVIVPIHAELLFALESERERRKPEPSDRVLLNPATGKPLTRPRLYHRMLALGKRADVADTHPHRFRDTLAVDMLARGASPYDVAKMLGDTIGTVEKHYTPFVRELRERVRMILETGAGLESLPQIPPKDSQNAVKKPN